MIDKVKIVLALLILIAGVYGYQQLPNLLNSDVSILLRVGVVIVAIIVALFLVATSEYGKRFIEFAKGSRTEVRKMIWPTRTETSQTTAIVLVLVVLVSIFLYLVDLGVFEALYNGILQLKI